MFRKSLAALGAFILLGGTLVGCGSSEKKQALEQERIRQEQIEQERIRKEKIRQEKYCAAVHEFSDLESDGTAFVSPGFDTINNIAVRIYDNAPAKDQEELQESVNTLITERKRLKEAANQDSFLASLAGTVGWGALQFSADYPAGRAFEKLHDYASMHRCDTLYARLNS